MSKLFSRDRAPDPVRLAQDKRRLQRVARDAGVSRAQAIRIASHYFKKPLKDGQ
ncbi:MULTISPECIES: hypothetical protein [unclassified Variovorax]|uniref:hypothetical protein n=1 Tax=unclassified Variovorax TaxID=663243 RepID=UPI00076DBDFB|nr:MULTISPECIES: hypothetical protein [unclassified Variovorax]KWT64453.1 hypothetical protein APY03_7631 [Variovorax sp. WDL1]PNG56324.1 hypothetical protein CHC07_02739 [Variovorax sp. B4]PNG57748.1 hypothetical protein CHC06_02742 [Variovorax sp. B2]VTV09820.1 hypothetical protein WDL1CHR_00887 [Variovorax sp. WDL1]